VAATQVMSAADVRAQALAQRLEDPDLEGETDELRADFEDGLTAEPPRETQSILFRIAQEAIANARKHAGADRIEVSIGRRTAGFGWW
jgi:signal transduction histidine kinase